MRVTALRAEDDFTHYFNATGRLSRRVRQLETALRLAHACATLRPDGTCDGCFVSEALSEERSDEATPGAPAGAAPGLPRAERSDAGAPPDNAATKGR